MTIVADHYLHYYARNVPDGGFYDNFMIDKKEAINESMRLFTNRKRRLVRKLSKIDNMDASTARALLSGKALSPVGEIIEDFDPSTIEGFSDADVGSPEAAIAIIDAAEKGVGSIENFVELLNNYLNSIPAETQSLLQDYAADLVEKFAKGEKNTGSRIVNSKYSDVDDKILASLAGRYNMEAFKVPSDGKLKTCLIKIKAMAESLPKASAGSYTVRHEGGSLIGKDFDSNDPEFIQELCGKAARWVAELDKTAKEYSKGMIYLAGNKKLEDVLKNVEHTFIMTGNSNFETNFIPDPEQERFFKEIDGALGRAKRKKKSKSDFGFYVGEDMVSGFIGVNAKNYKENLNPNASSATFKIQDETPLLTLMAREAGMSGNDIFKVMQTLVARGNSERTATLNNSWEKIKKTIAYKSFLSCLAGLENSVDQSYYMAISGKFYTMSDVFQHIRKSAGSDVVLRTAKEEGSEGFNRSTYTELNKSKFQKNPGMSRIENAMERSDLVEKGSTEYLYNAKMRVELKLSELVAFTKMAL